MKWNKTVEAFEKHLYYEEKAELTIQKYMRDVRQFLGYVGDREITKDLVLEYKRDLKERYQISSINSMLAAVNLFLEFLGLGECKVKQYRIQKMFFCRNDEYLTQAEYRKLVMTAERRGEKKLSLIMQTLCSTGIRISELSFVTVQAVKAGSVCVTNKGKTRMLNFSSQLCRMLLSYCKRAGIRDGVIFVSRKGEPMDRSVIWRKMKGICKEAGVAEKKVFPHNLRHLFAVTFYQKKKDLLCLAEVLGHSSVETTRIYTRRAGAEFEKILAGLGLVCGEKDKEKTEKEGKRKTKRLAIAV